MIMTRLMGAEEPHGQARREARCPSPEFGVSGKRRNAAVRLLCPTVGRVLLPAGYVADPLWRPHHGAVRAYPAGKSPAVK